MARLLPNDFDLSSIEHSERRVCDSLIKGLSDNWLVLPKVPVTVNGNDSEIDILLVSPEQGVIAVEVKGGAVSVRNGNWYSWDTKLKRSPFEQVRDAKYALLKRLKANKLELDGLFIQHVVALPDTGEAPVGGVGPDAPAELLFCRPELEHPAAAIARLRGPNHPPVTPGNLVAFLRAVRPTLTFATGNSGVIEATSRQLDDATRTHLAAMRSLDASRRVLVTGGAGTGKTWLALDWVRRALDRGERTLVVCFNRPIAEVLQNTLADTDATVGTYHDVVVRLLEPFGFRVGANPTPEYWEYLLTEALQFHADRVGTPFDTVIIDEAQDIRPHWFASLEQLLDPAGPQRILMVGDSSQAIYARGQWEPPADMLRAELVHNLRNARPIAELVHRLGGPEPLPNLPGQISVSFLKAGAQREMRKRVRACLDVLVRDHHVPPREILVLTRHASERDQLLAEPIEGHLLARWEQRSEETIVCETAHRAKGLERMAVIYVDTAAEPDGTLLYVGASRAVAWLFLVGSDRLEALAATTQRPPQH